MRRVERIPLPDSMIRKYGILLVPIALLLAMLCFGSLNSEWLLFYCAGSFAFSAASFRALKRADGIVKHFARVILGATACLSLVAVILRLGTQA